MIRQKRKIVSQAALLIAGIAIGWAIFGPAGGNHDHAGAEQTQANESEIWTCSMHPSVREDGPGSCPICGMDLIPAAAQSRDDDFRMVMTESAIALADIRTQPVRYGTPHHEIRLPGRVEVDERRITYVTTHFEGRMHHLKIDYEGAPIRKGEVMASIYSPELIAAQRELLESAARKEADPRLYRAVRQKFLDWEFTPEQIDRIEEQGEVRRTLEILSPTDGYVMKRNVVDGEHVMEGSVIYAVAERDPLWVVLEAYEEDIEWIRIGDPVRFVTRAQPSVTREGRINFIHPEFDPASRTVRLRADVGNRDGSLRPNMLVSGLLISERQEPALMIPESSLLWTGTRSLVYVKSRDEAGHPLFEAREVAAGARSGNNRIITEGLTEGEEVVYNGAFRIDSEFQLSGRFSMMNREPGGNASRPPHTHGDVRPGQPGGDRVDERPDGVDDSFRIDFRTLIDHYLLIRDALFDSERAETASAVSAMKLHLEEIGGHRMEGDAHVAWMHDYSTLSDVLQHMSGATDLASLRDSFRQLSIMLIESVERFGVEGVVVHQYCPMEKAHWLSDEMEIRNPYDPQNMPLCGEVIGRIGFQVP